MPLEDLGPRRAGRVDEPDLADAGTLVGAKLGAPVVAGRGGGEDLDDQVGRTGDPVALEKGDPVAGYEEDVGLVDLIVRELDRRPRAPHLPEIEAVDVLPDQVKEEAVQPFVDVERRREQDQGSVDQLGLSRVPRSLQGAGEVLLGRHPSQDLGLGGLVIPSVGVLHGYLCALRSTYFEEILRGKGSRGKPL